MPVAAINGKEMPEAKAFTLFHEVVHLMLAAGNEEAPAARERRKGNEWLEWSDSQRSRQATHLSRRMRCVV